MPDRVYRPRKARKLEAYRHLLGQMSDHELAKLAGCTASAVHALRRRMCIPAWSQPRRKHGQQ